MDVEPDVARIARTIGEPTRMRMLAMLTEGRAHTAKELAHGARVEPATATAHLRRLTEESLVVPTAQGRHKYFRLASPEVAHCIEALMAVAKPVEARSVLPDHPLHRARLCYDHLAGRLGTRIAETMLARGLLRAKGRELVVSGKGTRWCARFGLELEPLAGTRRRLAYACLDWSERKDHIGGALGAALAQRMIDAGWLKRKAGTRVITVTTAGVEALKEHFGLLWDGA